MYYIPHYAWYPHDHHAYPPCIPLFKWTFRLVVSLASLCFLNKKAYLLALGAVPAWPEAGSRAKLSPDRPSLAKL